jgi:glutamyl/glutaminyl-tRNA synthetase
MNTGAGDERAREKVFLEELGIKSAKMSELLRNKKIVAVVGSMAEDIPSPKDLPGKKKKLLCKVIEEVRECSRTKIYLDMILDSSVGSESDIRNLSCVLHSLGDADPEKIREVYLGNKPGREEVERIAGEIVALNRGEPRFRVLKELKHHDRLRFVEPQDLMMLVDSLMVGGAAAEKRGHSDLDLLEMATRDAPPTRSINRAYLEQRVPVELRENSDRKWRRFVEGEMQEMHCPFTNYQKSRGLLREHIGRTGGMVRVRFPPEPNGHLHIGHAKAMSINFGYRDFYSGWISLRYDDTNPKAEKQVFYDKILEMVEWMGFRPTAVTHASDYFDRLYGCAVDLIRRGKAYVCHERREDFMVKRNLEGRIKNERESEAQRTSVWRDRPAEESLREFERMKNGEYADGEAVLRMKMDMDSDNPQLWDLVAYRVIKGVPHPRTGSKWNVYPSYDFTHCLTDSFEDITHSFCTTEFINSRESYNWLCDALDLYRPVQWEYSRLNISEALLSKRFITKAIAEGRFGGWDDPRLFTLEGLRSRGVPARSIRRFVESLGITTAASEVRKEALENVIREDLGGSEKASVVLSPLRIRIVGEDREVFIDASDFSEDPDPNFRRLQKEGSVGLIGLYAVEFSRKCDGCIEVRRSRKTPSGHIQWTETDAKKISVDVVEGEDITTYLEARIQRDTLDHEYWQFLRIGFFRMSEAGKFIRVVPLKTRGDQLARTRAQHKSRA